MDPLYTPARIAPSFVPPAYLNAGGPYALASDIASIFQQVSNSLQTHNTILIGKSGVSNTRQREITDGCDFAIRKIELNRCLIQELMMLRGALLDKLSGNDNRPKKENSAKPKGVAYMSMFS